MWTVNHPFLLCFRVNPSGGNSSIAGGLHSSLLVKFLTFSSVTFAISSISPSIVLISSFVIDTFTDNSFRCPLTTTLSLKRDTTKFKHEKTSLTTMIYLDKDHFTIDLRTIVRAFKYTRWQKENCRHQNHKNNSDPDRDSKFSVQWSIRLLIQFVFDHLRF